MGSLDYDYTLVIINTSKTQTVFLQYSVIVTVECYATLYIYKRKCMPVMSRFYFNKPVVQRFLGRAAYIQRISPLASGLLIGVASMSATAGSLVNATEYLDYQLPEKIQKMCAERDNCPEVEVKYLKSNHSWIDKTVNARINNLIVNSKPTESAAIKTKNSQAEVNAAINDFAASQFQDMPEDMSDNFPWAYNLTVTPDYLGHVNDFELFEINSYVFTGGAHGMPYSEYLTFDLSTEKQVTLDDMIIAGKKPRFEALVHDAYKTWVKTVADDISSYEKSWPFMLSDNVTLTDTGINIRYQHYSIGPYAYGMPVLSISYRELDNVIKPHFIPK